MTYRVALFTEQFPPYGSGVARSARRLANQLCFAGQDVTVLTFDYDRPLSSTVAIRESREHPYPVLFIGPYHKGQGAPLSDGDKAIFRRNWVMQVLDYLRENPPDLIHAYFLLDAGFLAQVCALELSLPCVVSCRGNDIGKNLFNLNKLAAIRWIFEHVNWVTFVNEHLAARARLFFPSIVSRSCVIHNAVENVAVEDIPPALGLPEGALVGYVGRIGEKKGVAELVTAMEGLQGSLVLVGRTGRGTHDQYLQRRLAVAAGRGKVLALGERPWSGILGLLQAFDVFVQPSLDDGHPNALLEAMATGRPIVATDIFADVIEDGIEGILVPPGDAGRLRSAILRLLTETELASKLGEAARLRAEQQFTPLREVEANLSVYRQVVSP